MDPWSLTRHREIMTRPLGRISNALILLAAVLSPLQQACAATISCCCSRNSDTAVDINGTTDSNYCSQGHSCCSQRGESSKQACCQSSPSDSITTPCCCLTGCAGKDLPLAVDPANTQLSSNNELIGPEIAARSSLAADHAPEVLVGNATLFLSSPSSGAALCVLLCCFRL